MKYLLVLLVLVAVICRLGCHKVKHVTTLLNAKWNRPPLQIEISEYLYDKKPQLFWNFIDSINNLEIPLHLKETEKDVFETVINVTKKLLSNSELRFLRFILSLHINAPRIEMFDQIARAKQDKCDIFVEFSDSSIVCDYDQVANQLDVIHNQINRNSTNISNFDRYFNNFDSSRANVILYGQIGSQHFNRFHRLLRNSAQDGKINYILRHYIHTKSSEKLRLSGYDVELQMKSTEYKVQDDSQVDDAMSPTGDNSGVLDDDDAESDSVEGFRFSKLKELYPELSTNLQNLKSHLNALQSKMVALKVWEFQELSLQATEKIMQTSKSDALKEYSRISENFPVQTIFLYKLLVRPELRQEIKINQDYVRQEFGIYPPDTTLFINGIMMDLDSDIFSIVDTLRSELELVKSLELIGIPSAEIPQLFRFQKSFNAYNDDDESSDVEIAIKFNDRSVYWVNDIERDSEYEYLQYSPFFRKNLLNLIAFVDPSKKSSLKMLEDFKMLHYENSIPFRYGVVLVMNGDPELTGFEDPSVAMLAAFNYIKIVDHSSQAFQFLLKVLTKANDDVTVEDVLSYMKNKYKKAKLDRIFGNESKYVSGRDISNDFYDRTDIKHLPSAILNGVPISTENYNVNELRNKMMSELSKWSMMFQNALVSRRIMMGDDTMEFIMSQSNFMDSLNKRVINHKGQIYLDFADQVTNDLLQNLRFFTNSKRSSGGFFSNNLWIVGDLERHRDRTIFIRALKFVLKNNYARVSFILNPSTDDNINNYYYNNYVIENLLQDSPKSVSEILEFLESEKSQNDEFKSKSNEVIDKFEQLCEKMKQFSKRILNLKPNEAGVISNGRFLGGFDENETFKTKDFVLLDTYIDKKYVNKLTPKLKQLLINNPDTVDNYVLLKLFNLYARQEKHHTRHTIEFRNEKYSVLNLEPEDENEAYLELVGVSDPASKNAHKLAAILQVIRDVVNCKIKIFFNSVEKNSDMPVKSFYRFVLESEIKFDKNGHQIAGPVAKFQNMPQSPLLTQNILVPDNWLVEVIDSVYDLDNIKLENFEHSVHSEYELEYLLLEGHCLDVDKRIPPRGLQFNLGTQLHPKMVDTIVMANLGYFQLKANPGSWTLQLRDGRSSEIYSIQSVDGSDTFLKDGKLSVLLSSFKSKVIRVQVSKKEDKKNVELLSDDDSENGVWNHIANTFRGNGEEMLNIFSLASGHLYERFIKIMMLSVLKHTKTPVKFWFLKNFLSPQIKKFLPTMAKKYNFEYELVQYKWPKWLHQQTEKQRIIWGYKILFLDVLFPLDVKKIIFVDADQVVRADLKELRDLDLEGAPYGYTPFCESRREMDGFRFWTHGYWRNHLRGRSYHISALYVVDLKRFRRIAAGDRLRGQYQQLSQDPNSLANLDQDLPNNMIYQVAIKSLPQEWLWCETWCDDKSKRYAKTIDLCNNPLTKEAKLDAAVRIVEEWSDYDKEIKQLQEQFENKNANLTPPDNNDLKHEEL